MGDQRAFLNRIGHAPAASSEEVRELMQQTKTHARRRGGIKTNPSDENAKIWRADQRLCEKEYEAGTCVRYACDPPLFGVVVKRDGGSHWVEFPQHGTLRCNTYDLKVLKEGE